MVLWNLELSALMNHPFGQPNSFPSLLLDGLPCVEYKGAESFAVQLNKCIHIGNICSLNHFPKNIAKQYFSLARRDSRRRRHRLHPRRGRGRARRQRGHREAEEVPAAVLPGCGRSANLVTNGLC